jgi:hypothetical protein
MKWNVQYKYVLNQNYIFDELILKQCAKRIIIIIIRTTKYITICFWGFLFFELIKYINCFVIFIFILLYLSFIEFNIPISVFINFRGIQEATDTFSKLAVYNNKNKKSNEYINETKIAHCAHLFVEIDSLCFRYP